MVQEPTFVHSFGPCPEDSENPKPPAGHTNLEFIHLDDSTGPTQDGKTRRVVRAHVMRTYQRKKQLLENDARQSSENDKRPQHNIHLKLGIRPGNAHGEVPEEAVDKIYLTHHASGGLHRDLPGADVSQSSKTGRRENGAESTGMKKTHQTQVARSERKGGGTGRRYRGTIGFTLNQSRADSLRKIGSHSHEAPVGPWGSNAWSTGERHIYTPGPKNAAPLHSIEPFNAMPSFRSPRLHELMHHYNTVFIKTLLPIHPREVWFNYAVTDLALFHATLLCAAIHSILLSGIHMSSDVLSIRRETILLVNERLSDPSARVTDATIGAVACLALFEGLGSHSKLGNDDASTIHMDGLQRMLELRGGLDALGLSGILRRLILWADLVDATLALSTPRFNLSTSNLHPDIKEADTSALMYPEISISCTCVEQLQYIFHELRSITFSVTVEENITSVISDRIYVAERQLLLLAKSLKDAPHIHSSSCVAISNSIVQAALIYLVSSLRDCPLIAPLFGRYLGRLCDHIWKHNPLAVWEGKYSMLLWTVVMGVMVADGAPERARLVRLAAYVCCIQSINSQDDLLACVKDILWRDGSRFGLQKLWSDIEYIMLKELIYLDIWADQFIGVFL